MYFYKAYLVLTYRGNFPLKGNIHLWLLYIFNYRLNLAIQKLPLGNKKPISLLFYITTLIIVSLL